VGEARNELALLREALQFYAEWGDDGLMARNVLHRVGPATKETVVLDRSLITGWAVHLQELAKALDHMGWRVYCADGITLPDIAIDIRYVAGG
jgi:hypothetical protein